MLAEQTLLNAAVLTTDITADDAAVAGFVFNVLLIARAPLQLFQAVQGSLLPHLAGLEARAGRERRAARCASPCSRSRASPRAVAIGLIALGPVGHGPAVRRRRHLRPLGARARRARHGLPPDGRERSTRPRSRATTHARAAAAWLVAAVVFVIWLVVPVVDDPLLRAEVGYFGAAALLCGLLAAVYRRVG